MIEGSGQTQGGCELSRDAVSHVAMATANRLHLTVAKQRLWLQGSVLGHFNAAPCQSLIIAEDAQIAHRVSSRWPQVLFLAAGDYDS